jgi:hypothetical protein
MEQSFSLVGILTNSCQCRLQINNLNTLIFLNNKLANDPKFGGCVLEDMGKVTEIEVELTKDLEKNPKVIFQHGIFLNLWD